MERIFQDVGAEVEMPIGSIVDRLSRTEQAVQDLQTQMSALNAAVERALSSLLPKVESLLRGNASTNASGAISNPRVTSVSEAAAAGDAVALSRILANGGDANQRDTNGVSALHLAAAKGHVEAVGALLDGGARLDLTDPEQRIALHIATAEGHMDVVRRLLEAGSEVEVKDSQGNTPFMVAVNAKHWHIVQLLVEKGADPNATVFEGKSALTVAAEEGEIETVKVMLRKKRPTNIWPALSYAKNASVVQAFEEALPGIIMKEGGRAILWAAKLGRLESMVALLDAGVDINCYNQFRDTALMLASIHGRVECVNELVRRGASLNGADRLSGQTALHVASMEGHEDVVRVLLDAGADATKRDAEGETALECAKTDAIRNIIRRHLQHLG